MNISNLLGPAMLIWGFYTICTKLHVNRVGWSTRTSGVPFPSALAE
jgi:hypothetical protein